MRAGVVHRAEHVQREWIDDGETNAWAFVHYTTNDQGETVRTILDPADFEDDEE